MAMLETPWRFESSQPHHPENTSLISLRFSLLRPHRMGRCGNRCSASVQLAHCLSGESLPVGGAGVVSRHLRVGPAEDGHERSEEHTSELQSLMRISYAVFCLKKKIKSTYYNDTQINTYM